ncbi:MAG: transporter substrate-binding domain-containing protein [Lachnospiraceae bacterium]|nr:transporter substrate-binding domain-containing protein [Lachnospiraceae bacterium]MBO5145976.1 transporter substrate-binding domain-containing protein [Lachnospiraceae bacterium]
MMKKLHVSKKMVKRTGCIVLTASMMAALAGCGSTASSEQGTEASGTDGVEKIVVATGNSFAPYCYLDENGNAIGYDVDVLKAIDERLPQYEFDIQAMAFNTAVVSIDSGAADMVSFQLVPSDERKEKYLFPEKSYFYSPLALCVKTDSGITGLEDMGGKTIYGTPTTYEYALLSAYNEAHPETAFEIVAVTDMEIADMYRGVSNGSVDASLTYETAFATTVPAIGVDNLMLTDTAIVEGSYHMIAKDKPELCEAVNTALTEMLEDGTLSELSVKYFGDDYFTKYADMVDNSNLN